LLNTANYNALLTNHGDELTSAFRTLTGYFKRTTKGMKPAQDALDRFVTRMTTSYSTVKGQPTFCHTAGWVGQRALSTPKGQLGTLANEHLAELRESLKGGNDQALRGVSFGSMVVSRRIPSLEKRCWSKKGLYNARKCG
jgi:hypothetical protein